MECEREIIMPTAAARTEYYIGLNSLLPKKFNLERPKCTISLINQKNVIFPKYNENTSYIVKAWCATHSRCDTDEFHQLE